MTPATSTTKSFRVAGHQVVRILGTGAHSTIWEVRNAQTGQIFALKRVIKDSRDDERFFEQTRTEYNTAQKINHPNVRKVHRLQLVRKFVSVKEMHLLMEFCPGRTVQENPPSDVLTACDVFSQVANAMHRFNQAGFVHADMKPNNIIVDNNGMVKIIDFGQSCPLGTIKDRIQGTPDYIAPEQVHRWPMDARTDVFNFGATLYWVLAGKPIPTVLPRAGSLHVDSLLNPKTPSELNPAVPPLLNSLVMDCIQLQPKDRPSTMQEVITRLGVVLKRHMQDEQRV